MATKRASSSATAAGRGARAGKPATFDGFANPQFFTSLAKNNNKAWFDAHKSEYEDGFQKPMLALLEAVRGKIDRAFPDCELAEPKVFRLNRDIRFAKDKSPYKTHVSGILSSTRDGAVTEVPAALYLQVGTESFVGAGQYVMSPEHLERFRHAVVDEKSGRELDKILRSLEKKGFSLGSHDTLKKVPRGFEADHPRAELLKRKGLVVSFPTPPKGLVAKAEFAAWLTTHAKSAAPLVRWLVFATA
jgi:uncharacterized protein (TIGR02453 family)